MVVIRGVVRDGKRSTSTSNYYINGASITYGGVTTSSAAGFFEISSDLLLNSTLISIAGDRFTSMPIDMVSFGKKFDPNSRISGTILDAVTLSGKTGVTVLNVLEPVVSGAYISSAILVTGGMNSGQTCYILSNTENSFHVGF